MTDTPHAVMIFAAGFGTRMMPLTKDRPKPLIEMAGRPLIDHTIDLAREAGMTRLVANLHYKAEMLDHHLSGTGVETVVETPDILDTGGGLRNALPILGQGPVATINPDYACQGPNPLTLAKRHWDPDRMDALLVCIPTDRAVGTNSSGDFTISPDGVLQRGPGAIYCGVQILKTDRLAEIPETVFSLNRLWDLLIADKRCFGIAYPGWWCDVGRPENIALAEDLLKSHQDV